MQQLAIAVGITLVYCGLIALAAFIGERHSRVLKRMVPRSRFQELLRHWGSWCAVSCALFPIIMLFAMADKVIVAALLVIPYAYFTAVGIFREPPLGVPASRY